MTRPGYAREYHTQNYYKSYWSPSGRDPEPASPLPAINNRQVSRKGQPKREEERIENHQHQKHSIDPFNPRKVRASTAAMKRESYTCRKVKLPHCVYGEAMMHEVHRRPRVVTHGDLLDKDENKNKERSFQLFLFAPSAWLLSLSF